MREPVKRMRLSPITDPIWSAFVFAYKIFGLQPGFAEGLVFHSCVQHLQNQPDLWLDECPYLQACLSTGLPEGLWVELVGDRGETDGPPIATRRLQDNRVLLALAA